MGQDKSKFQAIIESIGEVLELKDESSKKINTKIIFKDTFYIFAVLTTTISYTIAILFILFASMRESFNISNESISNLAYIVLIIFIILVPSGIIFFILSFSKSAFNFLRRKVTRSSTENFFETLTVEEGFFIGAKDTAKKLLSEHKITLKDLEQTKEIFNYKINFYQKAESSLSVIYKYGIPVLISVLALFGISNYTNSGFLLPSKVFPVGIATVGLMTNFLLVIVNVIFHNKLNEIEKYLLILNMIITLIDSSEKKEE